MTKGLKKGDFVRLTVRTISGSSTPRNWYGLHGVIDNKVPSNILVGVQLIAGAHLFFRPEDLETVTKEEYETAQVLES